MSNKLKDIFSDAEPEHKLTFHFQDPEKNIQFRKALEKVYNEGQTVGVDGINSIDLSIKNGNESYPLEFYENIPVVNVGLIKRKYSMAVNTKQGEKEILFETYRIQENVILETGEKGFVFLMFSSKDGSTFKFLYRLQFENAKATSQALEDLYNAIEVINYVFKSEDESSDSSEIESIEGIREMFRVTAHFLEKLCAIEKELKIEFDLTGVTDFSEEIMDIDELYCLIVKKAAVRLNAKSLSIEAIRSIPIDVSDEFTVGMGIELTFIRENKYSTCGRDICIYTANLLTNAVIKEIQGKNDQITVLYGDTDSKPMYISYTGYKTKKEADDALELIAKNKDRYINALTMMEHMQKMNLEDCKGRLYNV